MGVKQTVQNKRYKCSGKDTPLPIFDLSLLQSVHHLERMVRELSLSGEFSQESLELLSHDLSGRLFHTWAEQEVTFDRGSKRQFGGFRSQKWSRPILDCARWNPNGRVTHSESCGNFTACRARSLTRTGLNRWTRKRLFKLTRRRSGHRVFLTGRTRF